MNKLANIYGSCLRLTSIIPHKIPLTIRTNTNPPTSSPPTGSFLEITQSLNFAEQKAEGLQTNPLPLPTSVPEDFMKVLKVIKATDNICIKVCKHNIIATLTTPEGKPLDWSTCGMMGFKNARKRTDFASTTVGRCIGEKALALKIGSVHLKIKGVDFKRRIAVVKGIFESGVHIIAITDTNRLPFGKGPKPPGKRSR